MVSKIKPNPKSLFEIMFGQILNTTCFYLVPWSPLTQSLYIATLELGRHGNAIAMPAMFPMKLAISHSLPL
jgi:hypothetical protein